MTDLLTRFGAFVLIVFAATCIRAWAWGRGGHVKHGTYSRMLSDGECADKCPACQRMNGRDNRTGQSMGAELETLSAQATP